MRQLATKWLFGMKTISAKPVVPILLLVLVSLVLGCGDSSAPQTLDQSTAPTSPETPSPTYEWSKPTAESAPASWVKVMLSLSELPLLGKPVEVTATFSIREQLNRDLPNSAIEIILPDGFEFVSGDLKQIVDIMRGTDIRLKATIKSVKTGKWEISARALSTRGQGGGAVLYTTISEDSATVSDKVPTPDYIPYEGPIPRPTIKPTNTPTPSGFEPASPTPPGTDLQFESIVKSTAGDLYREETPRIIIMTSSKSPPSVGLTWIRCASPARLRSSSSTNRDRNGP